MGLEQPRRGSRASTNSSPRAAPAPRSRFQQLSHDPEREWLLELGTRRLENGHLRALGRGSPFAAQLRLADAGGALDQQQRALAAACALETVTQRFEFALALAQRSHPGGLHDPTILLNPGQVNGNTRGNPRGSSLAPPAAERARCLPVPTVGELNKRKVRLFIEAVLNDGRLELINKLVAADFIGRIPWEGGRVHGPDGVRRLVAARRSTYPELYVKIDDLLAEEDLVATRWQLAPAGVELAASGCAAADTRPYSGISIVRLLAGKQVDSYTVCSKALLVQRAGSL